MIFYPGRVKKEQKQTGSNKKSKKLYLRKKASIAHIAIEKFRKCSGLDESIPLHFHLVYSTSLEGHGSKFLISHVTCGLIYNF